MKGVTPRREAPAGRVAVSEPRYTADQVRRRRAMALRVAIGTIVVVGLLFVVVFPVAAWMDQRADISREERRLAVVREERVRLQTQARRLASPAEIERLARELFGMVRPGETAWSALGPDADGPGSSTTSTTLPLAR